MVHEKIYSESVNWMQILSFCESIVKPLISINADMSWSAEQQLFKEDIELCGLLLVIM
jgi:hypothetical protein